MKKLLLTALLLLPIICYARQSDVYIGLNSKYDPNTLPHIALAKTSYTLDATDEERKNGDLFMEVLRSDLYRSRYFNISDGMAPVNVQSLAIPLQELKDKNIGYLAFSEIYPQEDGTWRIHAYLYDTENKNTLLAKVLKPSNKTIRQSAHMFADLITKLLSGKRGLATTRIAFANNSTGRKEIYIVDYDGYNLKRLTNDKSIALLPRWGVDSSKIYYTSYRYKNPDILMIDLKEGKTQPFLKGKGLNLVGGISPDDKKVVMTISRGDNPSIFLKELGSDVLHRLTDKYGVDGSPSFSPDGKFITFISNRSGNPQVYIMNLDTKETRRLTKFNWTDTPQWSPNGDWIAFSGRQEASHPIDIFIVDITGSQVRQLTADNGSNEDPFWSPDGRFLSFTTNRSGKRQIYVMDADGSAQHLIANVRGDSFTPSWSN